METWEQVLLGIGAVVILFLFWPGAKKAATESPKGTREDWIGLAKPIAAVVVFVIVLVVMVKG
jgi:NADH:ubiquinone oxidoreductase subunit 6 (subunit J)